MSDSTPDNAFDYLAERIFNHRCTPFIGAGISNLSQHPSGWQGHKVAEMIRKVLEPTLDRIMAPGAVSYLCGKCHSCFHSKHPAVAAMPTKKEPCRLCDLRRIWEKNKLAEACEAFVWEHPNFSEAIVDLVNTLDIAQFAGLEPTPAHYYLAFLAREGLITEFISTNYDCNLEKAYRATLQDDSEDGVDRIADLPQYTQLSGAASHTNPGRDTLRFPKLYKINGCAQQYAEDSSPQKAQTILLTEGQLQNWRTRHWAADLFRVKFRSSSIVLIGFGNEEPQIRHTVQEVLEEYSHHTPSRPTHKTIFDHTNNAPIVTLFEPYPSFPQRQLIHGFAQWMGFAGAEGEKLLCGPEQFSKHFKITQERLPADTLWLAVYKAIFFQLIAQALDHAKEKENAAFTGAVPGAHRLLKLIHQEWQDALKPSDPTPSAALPFFWGQEGVQPHQPRLTALLNRLLKTEQSETLYTAINDHRSLVAELVALHWLLQKIGSGANVTVAWHEPVLSFACSGAQSSTPLHLLVGHGKREPEARPLKATAGTRFTLHLVLGAKGAQSEAGSYRLQLGLGAPGDKDSQQPMDVVRLSWRHLFPSDLPPIHTPQIDIPKRLEDAMRRPSKYLRRAEASVAKRPYLQEVRP